MASRVPLPLPHWRLICLTGSQVSPELAYVCREYSAFPNQHAYVQVQTKYLALFK